MRPPEQPLTSTELLGAMKTLPPETELTIILAMKRVIDVAIVMRNEGNRIRSSDSGDQKTSHMQSRESAAHDALEGIIRISELLKAGGITLSAERLCHFLGVIVSLWPMETRFADTHNSVSPITPDWHALNERSEELAVAISERREMQSLKKERASAWFSIRNIFRWSKDT